MFNTKSYNTYDDYVEHQKSKAPPDSELRKQLLTTLWESDCIGFRKNFEPFISMLKTKKNALCLGARTGQEVHVLRELGLDAIGIDLIESLPLVLKGDVHNLTFANNSFDFIFSNIFDHVLYPEKFISEVKRVLNSNGYCLLHLSVGDAHPDGDPWASCNVSSSKDVIDTFGNDYTVIENKLLAQKDWPTYWSLMLCKKSIQK